MRLSSSTSETIAILSWAIFAHNTRPWPFLNVQSKTVVYPTIVMFHLGQPILQCMPAVTIWTVIQQRHSIGSWYAGVWTNIFVSHMRPLFSESCLCKILISLCNEKLVLSDQVGSCTSEQKWDVVNVLCITCEIKSGQGNTSKKI